MGKPKMEAHSEKSKQLEIAMNMQPFQFPFPGPFSYLFQAVSRQVAKGVRGTKMGSKGAQTEPKDHKIEPQGPAKY